MNPPEWLANVETEKIGRAVLRWYDRHGRDLPWRRTVDPYHVLVSEIMLQQTQVSTVLAYFPRFLQLFPTLERLARAEESDVLHAWQGLGYYRRARNLKAAAERILLEHGGRFPDEPEQLAKLPGLGRYTANAIACFAFGQRRPILEANTVRVWTRVCAAAGDPAKGPLLGDLWELAESVLPSRRVPDFNQALMDLGSEVCLPRGPRCVACPLRSSCVGHAEGNAESFPRKGKKAAPVHVDHVTVVIRRGDEVLVTQRPPEGRWANLWEFPRVERKEKEDWHAAARRAVRAAACVPVVLEGEWMTLRHGIMHYRVLLKCFEGHVVGRSTAKSDGLRPGGRGRWVPLDEITRFPFSSPQRRIVASLLDDR